MTKRLVLDLAQLLKHRGGKKAIEVPTPEVAPGAVAFILDPEPNDRDLAELQWVAYQKRTGITGVVGFLQFLVAWCLVDEKNKRLIDSGTDQDVVPSEFIQSMQTISKELPMRSIMRLFDAAHKSMGLNTDDIEELVKNSPKARPVAGSGSKRRRSGKAENNGSVTLPTPKS